jgi:hypothetical protein
VSGVDEGRRRRRRRPGGVLVRGLSALLLGLVLVPPAALGAADRLPPATLQPGAAAALGIVPPAAPFPAAPLVQPARRVRRAPARSPGPRGTLRTVPVLGRDPGPSAKRFRVEVEGGLRVDRRAFAARVTRTLRDSRSWGGRFVPVDGGRVDFRVVLASPETTDRLCLPLQTRSSYSCGVDDTAVLNFRRWREGAAPWEGRLAAYRRYMVNHEVGHVLGHGHVACPAPGARAPIMLQQTKELGGCRANPWPSGGGG